METITLKREQFTALLDKCEELIKQIETLQTENEDLRTGLLNLKEECEPKDLEELLPEHLKGLNFLVSKGLDKNFIIEEIN